MWLFKRLYLNKYLDIMLYHMNIFSKRSTYVNAKFGRFKELVGASGFFAQNIILMVHFININPDLWLRGFTNVLASTTLKHYHRLSNPPPFILFWALLWPTIGRCANLILMIHFYRALCINMFLWLNQTTSLIPKCSFMFVVFAKPSIALNKLLGIGTLSLYCFTPTANIPFMSSSMLTT